MLASGAVGSISDAWHVASDDLLKADLAEKARQKFPHATEEGIRRRVVKELDIRDAMRNRREAIIDRLVAGYRWAGGEDPATGRERSAFTYLGLRSDEHPLLKLFASCLPKARPAARNTDETVLKQSLMVGTKEFTRAIGSKLLGLDEPYVEGQKSVRGFIRIDCDGVFASWDALRLALIDVLDSIDLLPHIVVGDELSDGRIVRPHFIWLLPEKSRVRFDSKAFPAPQRLYHAVARALTAAMIDVGSDLGGLSNPMRVKNPLCPHWSVAILNERDPMTLRDMFVRLEQWIGEDDITMAERQVAVRARAVGIDECQSNQFFRDATAACWALARQWGADGDERGALTGDDLAEAFVAALGHDARHAMQGVPPRKAMAMLGSVCRWAARHFDPSARRRTAHPGVLRGTLTGLSLHDRQAAGGRHAAGTRRDASIDAIRQAIEALRAEGLKITKAAVADRAGVAYRTVLRLWGEAATVVSKAPKTSVKMRTTDSLRKIARVCSGAPSSHHTTVQDGGSDRDDAPATVPSATILPFRPVPSDFTPPSSSDGAQWWSHAARPSLGDDEDDEDVIALIEYESWLSSQDRAPSEPPPWDDSLPVAA
ncbi:hypothetical protein ANOBCDAF_00412 [Pleomorphomonas sp. T1.2MG-36]|nr:hypothetical protein ANOBCDAF_00412 [Pleomorphomonas sp. T1.2MG-36]